MNKIFKNIGALVLGAFLVASCTPDSFGTVDPAGIPSLEGIDAKIEVDQETNQVTFSLPDNAKGLMPIWIKDGKEYSTQNGMRKIYATAGTYEIEMKLMNKNGISDGSKKYSFTLNNTIIDFTKYYTMLAGGTTADKTKEWRMDNELAGHMGCGPAGTDGSEWWKAQPNDKASVGIYDNRIVFGGDGTYTYDPGTSGTMYVNTGVKGLWPDYEAAEDYTVPMEKKTVNFEIEAEGNDLYLVLPAETPFLYVPYVENWKTPRFRIESITTKAITLITDNGDISWRYVLTSGAAATVFDGYNYKHEANLWRSIDENKSYTTHYFYAHTNDWVQLPDPAFVQDGATYKVSLPTETVAQWQAQCAIKPNSLSLTTGKTYDFSCKINSTKDIKGVTVKLTDVSSGENFVFAERVDVKAYEEYIFYLTDVNNLKEDADCELFFDFGGNPAETEVTVSNIVVKDHAIDDGTVLPGKEDEDDPGQVNFDPAKNLWKGAVVDHTWTMPGWEAPDGTLNYVENNGTYTIELPDACSDRWQAQFFLNSRTATEAGKLYDFRVVLTPEKDIPNVTVKWVAGDDFYTDAQHNLVAYEDNVITLVGAEGIDCAALQLVLDFGFTPADNSVVVKEIAVQEHNAGPVKKTWDVNDADNMWTATMVPNSFFYAHTNDWVVLPNPEVKVDGRSYTVFLPTETVAQWQAQVTTETELSTEAGATYDFQIVLTSNKDIPGATVKLTKVGDDNTFFTEDKHALSAYEECVIRYQDMPGLDIDKVKLVLDFGGCPADTEVEVSNIILRKCK